MGDTSEKSTLNAQLQQVATAVPRARVRVGKTSDARTQVIGPKEREKTIEVRKIIAMPARCAVRLSVVPGGKEATIAASTENVHTKVAAPKSSGFLRPTRSRKIVMKLTKDMTKQYLLKG